MAKTLREKIAEVLVSKGFISKEKLEEAIKAQHDKGGNLSKILVEKGLVNENELLSVFSQEFGITPINLSKYKIEKEIISLVPEKVARLYHLIPVSKIGNRMTVAMSDPLNIFALDDLKILTKYEIDPVLATDKDIKEAIAAYYGEETLSINRIVQDVGSDDVEVMSSNEDEERFDVSELAIESQKAPILKMVDVIVSEALKRRASDIHIEPLEKDMRIRYRIDGALNEFLHLPKSNQAAVLTRVKIMSDMDITEWRLPQDGRFKVRMDEREIDFRVSTLPLVHGEKVVCRVLDKQSIKVSPEKLGFLPKTLEELKEAISKPYGMFLVTGPTGSGKSTTLYSILNILNTPEKNIVTIEDPIEYELMGITQVQVKPEIGLTFAGGLRAFLRQAPDIVMVGEIRDFETADIAIKASLTGQLLLSTLHTNDAPSAVTRLIDMGVEPFLVASSVVFICAQRLMKRVCSGCKEPVEIPKEVLAKIGYTEKQKATFYKGKGCAKCNNTGYFGRFAILENLVVDDKIKEMILDRMQSDKIKEYAIKEKGMLTLRAAALENLALGNTTVEEVLRVTSEE
ncbi:MAG TPA: ATPase, T2SS/T4P/T4SS family [Candidatus Omnitrophota bacterium]|nr:Flp pilus assembly complex ATPase component TadA [Candidatus Omnitrophota bacterium]HOX09624.1 ATPase, T2SS/T4P/T4SS family [Candidatus Omnitrophota bacterium]